MLLQSSPGRTAPRCPGRTGLTAKTAAASDSPRPGRRWRFRVALALAAATCCAGVTGCAQFNKALGQQQAMVYFKESTPVSFKMKVRAACDNLPHVKALPIAKGVPLASAIDVVTYNTTGAGLADIARLEECVNKYQPQVEGVNVTDSSDDS